MEPEPQKAPTFIPSKREQEVLKQVLAILIREITPKKIYLFGSRAKEEATPHADFDLAIEGPPPPESTKQVIKQLVEAASGLYSVDVVFLDEVESGFRELILATGKVLYES